MCDDSFDNTAAEAICRYMNSSNTVSEWTTANSFYIQSNLHIALDDVQCGSAEWESCRYSEEHNCGHDEAVHLFCFSKPTGTIRGIRKRGMIIYFSQIYKFNATVWYMTIKVMAYVRSL